MAKKKGNKKKGATNPTSGPQDSITLRQEITGKIQPKVSNNVKSYLNHLENLATWASGQASIPSLAAFYGRRLAAAAESSAVPPNPSLILCQRSVCLPPFTFVWFCLSRFVVFVVFIDGQVRDD